MKLTTKTHIITGLTTMAAIALITLPAQAYVGPGAGLSLLSALWAVLAAIVAAVGFIVLWPIRKMMRKRKTATASQSSSDSSSS